MPNFRTLRIIGLFILPLLSQQDPRPGEVVMTSSLYRPPSLSTFEAETKLVEVGVVVRDPKGRAVAGFTKDDFEIADEGKKRQIETFAVETSAPASVPTSRVPPSASQTLSPAAAPQQVSPRYVALLVDDTSMELGDLVYTRDAALSFINDGMRAGDRVGLFTMSAGQVVGFTTDAAELSAAIRKISFNRRSVPPDCPGMTPYEAYLIANQISLETFNVKIREMLRCLNKPAGIKDPVDSWVSTRGGPNGSTPEQVMSQATAIWAQAATDSSANLRTVWRIIDALGKMPGNRAVLLASSGFLSGTLDILMDGVISEALRQGVVINSIDAKGLFTASLQAQDGAGGRFDARSIINMQKLALPSKEAANDALAALSYNTGGLFFHNRNDLEAGFRELGMRPSVSYLLGFTPTEAPNGRYHNLKVKLKTPGEHIVQSRLGYVAVKPAAPGKASPERPIDIAASADTTAEALPGELSAHEITTQTGERGLMTVFHVDIGRLAFRDQASVRRQKLDLVALLTDANGVFVTGKEGAVTLALSQPTFDAYSSTGMNFTLTLVAPPGSYRLRAVMSEALDGKLSARTLPLEIQ